MGKHQHGKLLGSVVVSCQLGWQRRGAVAAAAAQQPGLERWPWRRQVNQESRRKLNWGWWLYRLIVGAYLVDKAVGVWDDGDVEPQTRSMIDVDRGRKGWCKVAGVVQSRQKYSVLRVRIGVVAIVRGGRGQRSRWWPSRQCNRRKLDGGRRVLSRALDGDVLVLRWPLTAGGGIT